MGRPVKALGGVWPPPAPTPEETTTNPNGEPPKQGTSYTLEKKNGTCLPLTAGTLLDGKEIIDLEWCFNECKKKAAEQGKTCERFIFNNGFSITDSYCWWEHGNCSEGF